MIRRLAVALLLATSALAADTLPLLSEKDINAFATEISGDAAMRTVTSSKSAVQSCANSPMS